MPYLTKSTLLAAASGLSLVICPALAFAQTTTAPDVAEVDDTPASGIEVILVTAQKRSENVQDVPATVTALNTQALELRQISSASDLQGQVPSLVIGTIFGANLITLRGISSGLSSGTDDPSVATHIDGAYQPRSRSIDIAMIDLERVEVLAGPQGTLYGRNATGGVMNYVLRGASDKFEGELTGRVGNYGRFGVSGSVSGPISDKVGIRVSGLYDDQSKGFTRVLNANSPQSSLDDYRAVGGRVVLDMKPSDTLKISLEAFGLKTWGSTSYYAFAPSLNPTINAALQPQTYRPHETYTNENAELNNEYFQTVGTVTWDLTDDVSLKSISAYQKYSQFMVIDSDASATAPFRGPTTQKADSRTITQEINLSANLFDSSLKSIFGFYYFNDNIDLATDLTIFAAGKNNFHTFQQARSYAFFTHQTFSVTDSIRLIAGLRYNHDKKTVLQSFFLNRNDGTVANIFPATTSEVAFNSWTPHFGFQIDLNPEVMFYGTYSKGFKSGGFASNVTSVNSFRPETIKGGEVGFKSDLADGRIRLNLAGYYYDYKDLQVTSAALVNNISVFSVRNAASSRIYGVEALFQAVITDSLKLDISGMVQNAKYTDFNTCNNTAFLGACGTPATTAFVNAKGNWLNRAPNYNVNVGLEYNAEVGSLGKLTVRGESSFNGRVFYDQFATPEITQKPYSIQNLFVSFTPGSDRFTVKAYVKNIGDTAYHISGFFQTSAFQQVGNWGPPRTFGADLTIRF